MGSMTGSALIASSISTTSQDSSDEDDDDDCRILLWKVNPRPPNSEKVHDACIVRVDMRVSSTLVSWSNENKSCMRVDKRKFAWEFHQLSCPGQTRTRVAWELTSESLHESFINSHVLVKREQELHESWQARVCMRVSSTLMWSENKSGQTRTRVAWELTSESLHESFINSHVLVKREQELHESWRVTFYLSLDVQFYIFCDAVKRTSWRTSAEGQWSTQEKYERMPVENDFV